jgi:hypothetical protein
LFVSFVRHFISLFFFVMHGCVVLTRQAEALAAYEAELCRREAAATAAQAAAAAASEAAAAFAATTHAAALGAAEDASAAAQALLEAAGTQAISATMRRMVKCTKQAAHLPNTHTLFPHAIHGTCSLLLRLGSLAFCGLFLLLFTHDAQAHPRLFLFLAPTKTF